MFCLFLPNVKFYFLISIILVFTIFWITKSWEKVVVYGFLPMSIYNVGQLYVFRVIQPEELNHPLYPDGRSLYFKFTPILVLGIAMIFTWLWKVFVYQLKTNWLIIVLLIVVLLNLISGMSGGVLPWWVELGSSIGDLATVSWIWWMDNFLNKANKEEREYFWKYVSNVLKVSILIGSLLVIVQGIKGSGLGLVVEQSGILPYFGNDEGGWLVRPIGIWTHANFAAYYILVELFAWILIKIKVKNSLNQFLEKWLLIPMAALVWLQSRSVFMAMFLFLIWIFYFYKKEIWSIINKINFSGLKLYLTVGILILTVAVITDRFWNSVTNFDVYSGWGTRSKLISVAIRLTSHHFWLGTGNGNFIPMAFREDLTNTMKTFPESVHNGWLLILAEQGIIALFFWLLFVFLFVFQWWKYTKKDNQKRWLLLTGLIGQFIIMLFQPFTNILTVNVIVGMLLLTCYEKKKF